MRRNLKEVEGIDLLEKNYIGQLAFISGASPYIVPITYYYANTARTFISCFSGIQATGYA